MIALRTNGCKNYDGCDDCLEANRLETIREEIQAMQKERTLMRVGVMNLDYVLATHSTSTP